MGESGGRPDAVGDVKLQNSTWGPSVGLWQIRSLKGQQGSGGLRDATHLGDPASNARSAFSLYQARGEGFADWTVWKNGAYRKFLPQARQAVQGLGEDIGTLPEGIEGSPEGPEEETVTRDQIQDLYRQLLGREADQAEVDWWINAKDEEELARHLRGTEEAQSFAIGTGLTQLTAELGGT